jgi:predicted RNA-binding Zn-ribbon protein involved in translation (DUF1610 family)
MNEQQARVLLETLKDLQENPVSNGQSFPCPRCGHPRMKSQATANALSRFHDVYICSECGTDEALRSAQGLTPLPLTEWGMIKGFSMEVDHG